MSLSLPLSRGRGVVDVDHGIAVLQLPGHSIGHHSSHLAGSLGGLRSSLRRCGRGLTRLRCSSHCKFVSNRIHRTLKGLVSSRFIIIPITTVLLLVVVILVVVTTSVILIVGIIPLMLLLLLAVAVIVASLLLMLLGMARHDESGF